MAFQTKGFTNLGSSGLRMIGLTVIFLSCLLVFVFLAYQVVFLQNEGLDRQVMAYFSQHRYPALVQMMRLITFFGSSFFLFPAYVVLIAILLVKRFFREALAIAGISFLSWLVLSQLKIIFQRHRPDLPLVTDITTYSFPSAHAFSSLIFFSILAFIVSGSQVQLQVKRVIVPVLLLFPMLVGLSRIILNVHYPTDVLAGYCLGTMWLVLSYLAFRKFTP